MKKFIESIQWIKKWGHSLRNSYIVLAIMLVGNVLLTYGEVVALQVLISKIMVVSLDDVAIYIAVYIVSLGLKLIYPKLLEYYKMTKVHQPFVTVMTSAVMNAFYLIPITKLKKRQKTVYIDVLTRNVSELSHSIMGIMGVIVNVLQLFVAFVLFSYISLPLSLVVCLLSLAYIFLGKLFTTKLIVARREYMEQVSLLHQAVEEASTSSREVLSYNRMAWETNRREKFFAKYYKSVLNLNHIGNAQYIVTNLLKWSVTFCVLYIAAKQTMNGVISIAMFVSIYRFCGIFIESVERVFWQISGISEFFVKVDRVRNIIDDAQFISEENYIPEIKNIEFKNVRFSYNSKKEATDIKLGFKVMCGQKIGIVGESGSGKTTLLKLVAQILEPNEGEVLINGVPLQEYSIVAWKKKVAVCFQDPYFFADTIETNIKLGREISEKKMIDVCQAASIYDTITSLPDGFQTVLADRGISFSGGERQRLALARMLLSDSTVFLLDEVTSSVHFSLGWELLHNIESIIRSPETFEFVVTHRVEFVQDADVIIVMDKGGIVDTGTHEELLRNCKLYKNIVNEATKQSMEQIGD